jgi:hypothetical protein
LINNSINNYDGWNSGIVGFSAFIGSQKASNHVQVYNNNILNSGCNGILVMNVNNWTIHDNNITQIPFNKSGNYSGGLNDGVRCLYEAPAGIFLSKIYRTYLMSEPPPVIDELPLAFSQNINIYNNTISGFSVLLREQDTINLTHDITNYWFRSFSAPTIYGVKDNFYVSNNFNNVEGRTTDGNVGYLDWFKQGLVGYGYDINYSVFKTYLRFTNLDQNNSHNIYVYNVSNPSIVVSDGTSYKLSGINKEINQTLDSNETMYVYFDQISYISLKGNSHIKISGSNKYLKINSW